MARRTPPKRASKLTASRQKRSVLPYPLIIFLLLCAGVFLIAWTFRAGADNIFVTAKVSAAFVTQPATIDSPADGAHFQSIPIQVRGTCPAKAGYTEIFENGVMRGAALCAADSSFQLSIDLFPGPNSLSAHVFNTTDDEGPLSAAVNVTYDAPALVSVPQQHNSGPPNNSAVIPLTLKTAFLYKGYHSGERVEWPLDISGGTAPYAINADWGDGTSDLLSRPGPGEFKISHVYSRAGAYQGSYVIKVKATDSDGRSAFVQFFVIVNLKSIGQTGNIYSKPPPQIGGGINWLRIAWPAYGLVVLMALSYLLGEREELQILKKRRRLRDS